MPPSTLLILAVHGQVRVEANETLFSVGDSSAPGIFIVVEGRLGVFVEDGLQRLQTNTLYAGETVGDLDVLDGAGAPDPDKQCVRLDAVLRCTVGMCCTVAELQAWQECRQIVTFSMLSCCSVLAVQVRVPGSFCHMLGSTCEQWRGASTLQTKCDAADCIGWGFLEHGHRESL